MYFRNGFPNVAYYIPDKTNLSGRTPFKCRIAQESPQFFSQSVSGLVSVGMQAQLVTYVNLEFKLGAKVLWNNVLYSLESITPYIPDPTVQGFTKARLQAEFLLQLV